MPKQKLKKRSDGRLSRQIYLGKDETGKRNYKTIYGKTQKELQEKYEDVLLQIRKGLDLTSQSMQFEIFVKQYLENKRTNCSGKYFRSIKSTLKHLEPLYKAKISQIKPMHVQKILNDLATREDKPLARKTLADIRNCAYGIFQIAVNNRVIDFNPVTAVEIPKGKGKKKREAISDEQIAWINETPHNAQTAAMIMLYSGLRRGELLALTWNDIDFKEKTMRINKAVEFNSNAPTVKSMTKTEAGMRLISIPDVLISYLKSIPKKSPIVCTLNGEMFTEGSWRRVWESYMNVLNEKYGNFNSDLLAKCKNGKIKSRIAPGGLPVRIQTFTPHQLRHTYASMLYKSGIDVLTAKEQLGHSDIKTTLNIYTHLDSLYKKQSMSKLNDYIAKTS